MRAGKARGGGASVIVVAVPVSYVYSCYYESHRLVDGRIPAARRLFRLLLLLLLFGSFSLSGQRSSTRPPDPSRFRPEILIDRSFLFPSADASSTRICFEKACLGGDHRSRRGPSCEGSSVLIDWRIDYHLWLPLPFSLIIYER